MSTVEIQIRSCCCCGLRIATILAAIYLFVFYIILLSLAAYGISRTPPQGYHSPSYYTVCADEVRRDNQGLVLAESETGRVLLTDASRIPYFCSLGLYTEELKFRATVRYPVLIIDILLYILLVISAVLAAVAIFMSVHWLLLPCIGLLFLDIMRGLLSVIFIFILSYGSLIRIAVGVFFLGIQIFHISLVLLMIAKFQEMYSKVQKQRDLEKSEAAMTHGRMKYPTVPRSQYTFSFGSPAATKKVEPHQSYYSTQKHSNTLKEKSFHDTNGKGRPKTNLPHTDYYNHGQYVYNQSRNDRRSYGKTLY